MGVDRAAAQAAGAAHDEAVLGRLDVGAEAAQAVDDGRDAVGLLQAQLGGAAHHRLALGEAAEQRDQRQLVDRQRHLVGLDHGAAERPSRATSSSATGSPAGCPACGSSSVADDDRAHPLRDAEEADARPVDRDVLEHDPRARHEHRGGGVEGGRRGVAGDVDAVELELVLRVHGQRVAVALDARAGAREHALGVVAARRRLDAPSSRPRRAGPRAARTT